MPVTFAGRKGMLVRKAAKLFVHAKDVIAKTSLASSIGQEYSALLRAHLLPVPQYCNVVSGIPFQGNSMSPLPLAVQPTLAQGFHKVTSVLLGIPMMILNSRWCMMHHVNHFVQYLVQLCCSAYRLFCCVWLQSCWMCTWVSLRSSLTEARTPSGICPACCYCFSTFRQIWSLCSSRMWLHSSPISCLLSIS